MQSTADVPPETCEVDEPCKQPWDRLLHLAMLCQADVYISIFCRSDAPEKAIKPFSRTKQATLGLSLPKCLERAPKNTAIPKEADSPLQKPGSANGVHHDNILRLRQRSLSQT